MIDIPTHASSYFDYRTQFLVGNGGVVASLKVGKTHRHELEARRFPELDLGYSVTKEMRIFVGNIDISGQVKKNPLIICELEIFLQELYKYHEKYYLRNREGEVFVNELFLMDGVDVVVSSDCLMNIDIDYSLRDYLVSLNERLRVSA